MSTEPTTTTAPPTDGRVPRAAAIALVLAFAAGATDAFAFLQLQGVFTANMTGNLVLAGLFERPGYAGSIVGIVVAIVVFVLTLYAAFRVVPTTARPARRSVLLVAGLVAQVAVLIGWWVSGGTPAAVVPVLIGLSAVAMAAQTALAKRIESRSGVTTTYVTGTLTSLMSDLADRRPQAAGTRIGVVVALVAGALADAALVSADARLGAALPILPALLALVLLLTERPQTDRMPIAASGVATRKLNDSSR
jgi:uncharacterized membrane protein YoaK (UPF0700 family)